MPNKWIIALKQYNAEKGGSWCVPRKGTKEYDIVRALMDGRPAVKKESVEEREAREGRNVGRRQTALEQLRAVEAASKARNVKREEEAKKAAAEEAPKKKTIGELRDAARAREAAAEAAEAKKAAPVGKKQLSDLIKNIKVGTDIAYGQSSGYMGDGGDGRDRGYTVYAKVLKVLPRGLFEVSPQYRGNEPEVFKINEDGDWLVDKNRGRLGVYLIDGKSRPEDRPAAAVEREKAKKAATAATAAKKAATAAEKPLEEKSKAELVRMIKKYADENSIRVGGITTASVATLLKFIKEKNIG